MNTFFRGLVDGAARGVAVVTVMIAVAIGASFLNFDVIGFFQSFPPEMWAVAFAAFAGAYLGAGN